MSRGLPGGGERRACSPFTPARKPRGGQGEWEFQVRLGSPRTDTHSVTDSARGLDDRSSVNQHPLRWARVDGARRRGRTCMFWSSDRLERSTRNRFGGARAVILVRARSALRRKDQWPEPDARMRWTHDRPPRRTCGPSDRRTPSTRRTKTQGRNERVWLATGTHATDSSADQDPEVEGLRQREIEQASQPARSSQEEVPTAGGEVPDRFHHGEDQGEGGRASLIRQGRG